MADTVLVYILKDDEPAGGYFAAQTMKPDMTSERRSVAEVRAVEMPQDVWEFALEGGLPVDVDYSNDSTWIEWWPEAEPVWTRAA